MELGEDPAGLVLAKNGMAEHIIRRDSADSVKEAELQDVVHACVQSSPFDRPDAHDVCARLSRVKMLFDMQNASHDATPPPPPTAEDVASPTASHASSFYCNPNSSSKALPSSYAS